MGTEPTNPHWPFFDLVVRTPRVELRPPTDEVLVQLADLGAAGIHEPGALPFAVPWTAVDPPLQQRNTLQHGWRVRAELTAERWTLPFAVHELVDDERTLVGVQDLGATDFVVRREVSTGSWLGRAHQGRGIGREMRAAVLHLAFDGLGAEWAVTGAWHDNLPSLGVTGSLPYRPDGEQVDRRGDGADRMLRFRMARADWSATRRDDIVITGLDGCLDVLGLR